MRAARSPDRTHTTAGAISHRRPDRTYSTPSWCRTRPQTERATDSAIRTQGACSLRRTAANRTPLWMRYQPAVWDPRTEVWDPRTELCAPGHTQLAEPPTRG